MKDDAYSLELLPGDLKQMSFTDANAIEANLQSCCFLISAERFAKTLLAAMAIWS